MFTPTDIVILILLVASVVFIWIARRSSFNHGTDESRTHDLEAPPSAERKETQGKTNEHAGYSQGKENDSPHNGK